MHRLSQVKRKAVPVLVDQTTEKAYKQRLYGQFAGVCKAFGNPSRFEILEVLAQGEHSVEELAQTVDISVASASQHLQVLRAARLVNVRRVGVWAHYSLASDSVYQVLVAVRSMAEEHIADLGRIVEEYLPHRQEEEPIALAELARLLETQEVQVLDVRPAGEYEAGHIPGAISTPLEQIFEHLEDLSLHKPIIIYGRGPYNLLADKAVAILRNRGYRVNRLAEGFPEWRMQGFSISHCKSDS